MRNIEAENSGEAWVKACQLVCKEGHKIYDGDTQLKEILNLFISVTDPTKKDKFIEKFGDQEMISWMVNDNFGGHAPVLDWGYCYGMRLHDYEGLDQVAWVVEKLKNNPEAKSATVSLMKPDEDVKSHIPCVVAIDYKIRDNKLQTSAFFRSQDVGKKLYADILAIGSISKKVSKEVGVELGKLNLLVVSAHIYEPDFDKVESLLKNNDIG